MNNNTLVNVFVMIATILVGLSKMEKIGILILFYVALYASCYCITRIGEKVFREWNEKKKTIREIQRLTKSARELLAETVNADARLIVGNDKIRIGNVDAPFDPLDAKELLNAGFIQNVGDASLGWKNAAYTVTEKGYHVFEA